MEVLSFYIAVFVPVVTTCGTTLCFTCYGMFRHRGALWLSLCITGLAFFALTGLVVQAARMVTPTPPGAGLRDFGLLWQALGSIIIVMSLPRFLLAAFGAHPGALVHRLLDAAALVVTALSVFRIAALWRGPATIAGLPNTMLRVVLFVVIGGALALTLVFQSRLPDRSLYKAVIVQVGALALLFPFVVLEDLGLFVLPGLPYLSGQVLIVATSVSATLHARRSLMRPKYVEAEAPSPYFVERFGISGRELEIVRGVLGGQSNTQIAEKLFISPRTVEKHLSNIYQKAGIRNRLQLFALLRSDTP